eukprot:2988149-Lingulodinium_polyedra.AAC.1
MAVPSRVAAAAAARAAAATVAGSGEVRPKLGFKRRPCLNCVWQRAVGGPLLPGSPESGIRFQGSEP